MKSRIRFVEPEDIENERLNLIQIVFLKTESDRLMIDTHEIRLILLIARAISELAFMVLNKKWDHYFLIDHRRVFICLREPGLFVECTDLSNELLIYIEKYERWRDARLALLVRGVKFEQASLQTTNESISLDEALEVLNESRNTITRSGLSLDEAFIRWMKSHSRVNAFSFNLPKNNGDGERTVTIPARSQILKENRGLIPSGECVRNNNVRVAVVETATLIESISGDLYLCFDDELADRLAEGSRISFDRESTRSFGPCHLLRVSK